MVEPCEAPPDLNIAYVLIGKGMTPGWIISAFMQFEIPRERLQHRPDRDGKETVENRCAVFFSQVTDRFEGQIERCIVRAAIGILFQLQYKRRNEIERLMNVRKFFDERRHSKVILRSMQVRPRHHIGFAHQIFVKRLVHVPEK